MNESIGRTFDRERTPRAALARWDGDPQSLAPVGESENFVYRFRDGRGAERYLRLSPPGRRSVTEVRAEIDFVRYLAANGAAVAAPIGSRGGELLEVFADPAGEVVAVVFEAIHGPPVTWGTDAENRAILFERGRSLGRIHRLASTFSPPADVRRAHWYEDDLFTDPLKYLPPSEDVARREYETLIQWMLKRPRTRANYGMVHGDFGSNNTRRRDDGWVVAFDFDDCCFHWFMYDLAVAIRAARKLPDRYRGPYLKVMLEGYASEKDPAGEGVAEVAMFCRLAALYRYVTLLRSYDLQNLTGAQRQRLDARRETLANPPTWE